MKNENPLKDISLIMERNDRKRGGIMSEENRCLCEYGAKQLLDENNIEVWFERYINREHELCNQARLLVRVRGIHAFDHTIPIHYCPICGVKIG